MNLIERHQAQVRDALTITDRLALWWNPVAGQRRLAARMAVSSATGEGGYKGGRRERRATKLWRPKAGSGNADTLPDLPDLVSRSRELGRNVPIAAGALATTKTNVVGDGLRLQANIDARAVGITDQQADEFEREQEREFELFCDCADFTGVQHFDEMSELAFGSVLDSGDAFVIRRFRKDPGEIYGTKLQLVEADRICNPDFRADTPTLIAGVEYDRAGGQPVAYHVADQHPGERYRTKLSWTRIPAKTPAGKQAVIHLFDRIRPDLARGVPYLAPVIEELKQFGEYHDAEVRAAVLTSFVTFFSKQNFPEDADADAMNVILGRRDEAVASDEQVLGQGAIVDLLPGEDIVAPSPSRPNPQFDAFTQAVLRQIGVALELPFELLIKHFTASYSASRAALEMAWQFFRKRRRWLARRLHAVAYGWMMEEAVASGRLVRPGFFEDPVVRKAWLGAEWIGPARASINPKQEAEADEIDVRNGTKTREQICIERTGGRWEDKHRQLAKEERLRKADGLDRQPQPQAGGAVANDNPDDEEDDDDAVEPQRSRA